MNKVKIRTVYNPRWWIFVLFVFPLISPLILLSLTVTVIERVSFAVSDLASQVNHWMVVGPIGVYFAKIGIWVNKNL